VYRAVISFLVAVPLLVPPGMCACRLGLRAPAQAIAASASTCSSPRRGCCGHRATAAQKNADRRASCRDAIALTESQAPTAPGKTHEPGCPALLTADHSKLAGQNSLAEQFPTIHVHGVHTTDDIADGTSRVTHFHPPGLVSQRLYVSFRTLLI
jgi:hypothetical protein